MSDLLRKNSRLRARLGAEGIRFLEHAAGGVERLLPHVSVERWAEGAWEKPRAVFMSNERRAVRVVLSLGAEEDGWSVSGCLTRLEGKHHIGAAEKTIDVREKDICNRLALLTSQTLFLDGSGARSLEAIRAVFDESIVADHLQDSLPSGIDLRGVLRELHQLSEETYENKQLSFGCLIPRDAESTDEPATVPFPEGYFHSKAAKRYKALSDGARTAYVVGPAGELRDLVELRQETVTGRHWFPGWVEPLAYETLKRNALALALTRQGDILVLDGGSLRFSYRFGRWRFWSHHHLVEVLKALARTNNVRVRDVRKVTDAVYRAALDISFRRTGALFVVLSAVSSLGKLVRDSDQIGHRKRDPIHLALDAAVGGRTIQELPRAVLADIAGIDGAVVLDAKGRIRAYGAVLEPKRQPKTRDSEGARTKAALAASRLGLAVKVSSDGDIAAYRHEERVFQV